MTTSASKLSSVRNRMLLVSLTFNKPQMTKLDRKATRDAEEANNATNSIRAQKLLYPKHLLDPIISIETAARSALRARSVPWGTTGLFLINSRDFMPIQDMMATFDRQRSQEVTKFAQNWARVMEEAALSQGMLFERAVYPDVTEVVQQFQMHLEYMPLGDLTPTMFLEVEEEIREQIGKQVEASVRSAFEQAMADPLEQLMLAMLNLYDKCTRKSARMHESVIEEMERTATLLESMNLFDLPALNKIVTLCRQRLVVDVATLKDKDSGSRAMVGASAHAVLDALGVDGVALEKSGNPAERKTVAKDAADAILEKLRGFL
jgi:hypothetical protein